MSTNASETARPVDSPKALGATQWTGFKTIVIREYGRIIRIWAQTIVPSAVTSALYFVIFGSLIGKRVGLMAGVPYMQYIAPGLIMMAVITNSYGNVVSSFFGAKFGKHVRRCWSPRCPTGSSCWVTWAVDWCAACWWAARSRSFH